MPLFTDGVVDLARLEEEYHLNKDDNAYLEFVDVTVSYDDMMIPFFNSVQVKQLRISNSTLSSKIFYGLVTKTLGNANFDIVEGESVVCNYVFVSETWLDIQANNINLVPILNNIRRPLRRMAFGNSTGIRLFGALTCSDIPVSRLSASIEVANMLFTVSNKFNQLLSIHVIDDIVDEDDKDYTVIVHAVFSHIPTVETIHFNGVGVTDRKLEPFFKKELNNNEFHPNLEFIDLHFCDNISMGCKKRFRILRDTIAIRRGENRINMWPFMLGSKALVEGASTPSTRPIELTRRLEQMLMHGFKPTQ